MKILLPEMTLEGQRIEHQPLQVMQLNSHEIATRYAT
jgi:hypothetical protein